MDRFEIKIGGKTRQFVILESTVAIMPDNDLKKQDLTKSNAANHFGKKADDENVRMPGTVVSQVQQLAFEKAGWIFAEPTKEVRRSAQVRSKYDRADFVREICVDQNGEPKICTDFVVVKFHDDYPTKQVMDQLGKDQLTGARKLAFGTGMYQARIPDEKNALEFVQKLQQHVNDYEVVEPVFLENLGLRFRPNDAKYPEQWQWSNNGNHGGDAGKDVDAEAAWESTRGAGVSLAVIDFGFHINSPELKSGIIGGGYFMQNGDGSSQFRKYVDGDDNFPRDQHGSFCASMAGARMGNDAGCGMAPECNLLLIACPRITTQVTLAEAINYAVTGIANGAFTPDHLGADVISCSLGPYADFTMTNELRQAIDSAVKHGRPRPTENLGTPLFWAVSNANVDVSRDEVCAYTNTIAVGSSDANDRQAGCAFGPELDFLAPGRHVRNSHPRDGSAFGSDDGTSFATPVAAGVAALMIARNPELTWIEIRNLMRENCERDKLAVDYDQNNFNPYYGFGRVNAMRSVESVGI